MKFDLTTKGTKQALDYLDSVIVKGINENSLYPVLSLIGHESSVVRHAVAVTLKEYPDKSEINQYLKKLGRDNNGLVAVEAHRILYGDNEFTIENYVSQMQTMPEPEFSGKMATRRTSPQRGLETKVEHNPTNFIIVPDTGVQISKGKLSKKHDWYDSHYLLAKNGLWMPSPKVWMAHYIQVLEAKAGKRILLDGNLNEIVGKELDEVYQNVTDNLIYLDGLFRNGNLETNHRVIDGDLVGVIQPTTRNLDENCFVNLNSLNKQGLPTEKSKAEKFVIGSNIYFEQQSKAISAAWFGFYRKRNILSCNGDPKRSSNLLGLFGCRDNKGE